MTDWFIKGLTIIRYESIQCFGMESCLVANIDRIIGRDDGEYETDEKKIMVYAIFQTYRWEKSYDESRMYRRHIPRSEHSF